MHDGETRAIGASAWRVAHGHLPHGQEKQRTNFESASSPAAPRHLTPRTQGRAWRGPAWPRVAAPLGPAPLGPAPLASPRTGRPKTPKTRRASVPALAGFDQIMRGTGLEPGVATCGGEGGRDPAGAGHGHRGGRGGCGRGETTCSGLSQTGWLAGGLGWVWAAPRSPRRGFSQNRKQMSRFR